MKAERQFLGPWRGTFVLFFLPHLKLVANFFVGWGQRRGDISALILTSGRIFGAQHGQKQPPHSPLLDFSLSPHPALGVPAFGEVSSGGVMRGEEGTLW